MSFLNAIFAQKSAPAPAPAPQTQIQNNAPQGQNQPQGQGNSGTQGATQFPNPNDPSAQTQANPLDAYSKLWDTTNAQTDAPPSFSIDPKVMGEVANAQDFFKGLDPELVQKAQSGDSAAFTEMMQQGMRNVYRTVIEHNGMLTDKFVGARLSHEGKGFNSKVKDHLTTQALSKTENFNHPAVKQQLIDTAKRIQTQNPDMPPEQVAEEARKYITELANAINPQKESPQQKAAKAETNWEEWFSKDSLV